MNPQLKLILPLEVYIGGKKRKGLYPLNLNYYRNCHYRQNGKAKILYSELVKAMIPKSVKPLKSPVRCVYRLYWGSNRKVDVSNVLSIVEKFTMDAVVSHGLLPDDDYRYVTGSDYRFGGIDKEFPRCEFELFEVGS